MRLDGAPFVIEQSTISALPLWQRRMSGIQLTSFSWHHSRTDEERWVIPKRNGNG
jgi:hypothetical protein